jgi:hypothetical protein
MALKQEPFIIESKGPDDGKVFLLTQMPAFQAEKWAIRAFLALIEGGVSIPEEIVGGGMEALTNPAVVQVIIASLVGGVGRVSWDKLEPLLDEMMGCVRICPDPTKPPDLKHSRGLNLSAGDIEEVPTLLKIRKALLMLHTGFQQAVEPSTSHAPTASMAAPITRMSRRA